MMIGKMSAVHFNVRFKFRLITCVLLLLAAMSANGQWTRLTTGCSCYFDTSFNNCACCNHGGCQCPANHRHQCVQCGRGEQCGKLMANFQWTEKATGCSCYFDNRRTDCACCQPGGCQCPLSNLHQCVQCRFGGQCGRPYREEKYIYAAAEWEQSRYDNGNTEEAEQEFDYVKGMLLKSDSKTMTATQSVGALGKGSLFKILSLQLTYNDNQGSKRVSMSEEEIYGSETIETTVTIPPSSTLIRYHLVADVAGTKIGCSHYVDILNDTQKTPDDYSILAKVEVY